MKPSFWNFNFSSLAYSLLYHFPERGLKLKLPSLARSSLASPLPLPREGIETLIPSNPKWSIASSLLYHFPERGLKPHSIPNNPYSYSLLYHFPERGLKLLYYSLMFSALIGLLYHFPERGLKRSLRLIRCVNSSRVSFTTSPRGD